MPRRKTPISDQISSNSKAFRKLLVANRGEIAIRIFRAATELKIPTVAIYTHEDRYSLHRYKADEAYRIGVEDQPLRPYLDISEIVQVALDKGVDAIHPGYGFLSENPKFARACEEAGITFIGPRAEVLESLGSKIRAKEIARKLGIPTLGGGETQITSAVDACREAKRIGFPVLVKAAAGGGGRGMRIAENEKELSEVFPDAANEALRAFGDGTLFLEKFLANPKHIEVQLVGDTHGNVVHLFERDCSVQRRYQKLVEFAPSVGLPRQVREKLYESALSLAREVNLSSLSTAEFLVDEANNFYFIEVNPRIQVEHTVTEEITGIDLVRSQILVAMGHRLDDPEILIRQQSDVKCTGFAVQCRVTTEDPRANFKPDFGRIIAYRSAGGFGIRLDEGSAYPGVTISPFFDSMLVKVTASGRTLWGACQRLERALQEFRVRGVSTNIDFLLNVISNRMFTEGRATVRFLSDNPELLHFATPQDRATRLLRYLAEVVVNGNPDVKGMTPPSSYRPARVPRTSGPSDCPPGTKQRLVDLGPEKFCAWLRESKEIQYTDTTFRDAHQSLIATRVRTIDLLAIAESFARSHPNVFSMEVWGGATFDVALRFLHECPWERLRLLRAAIPNILLQALIRGSNAVGYTAYPENVIGEFIEHASNTGIDIFRIFDSMNSLDSMVASIRAVRERTSSIAEASICYTGDVADPKRKNYPLSYFVDLARRLEDAGAHILCIKDMTGLLKPQAATLLITELRRAIALPIHLHTHDTSGIQAATYMRAIDAGVDVVDVALASMSGLTSQPNFNSIVAMMEGHPREQPCDLASLNAQSRYWECVREYYAPFESGLRSGTAEVYRHEIPGGQYSNLLRQARSLGLDGEFERITENYVAANEILGDLVKVTPSSKVVGDLALFMTSNKLSAVDVLERAADLAFPDSIKGFLRGELGPPPLGFPEPFRTKVLQGEAPPPRGAAKPLPVVDLEQQHEELKQRLASDISYDDLLSYLMYPKVFEDFHKHQTTYGKVAVLPTPAFLFGLKPDEEILVEIAPGKTLTIRLSHVNEPDEAGTRAVFFKLNGQTRAIDVQDAALAGKVAIHRKVEKRSHIGAPLAGRVSEIFVKVGDTVDRGTPLFILEAMKMESTIRATEPGRVAHIELNPGSNVQQDDLVLELHSLSDSVQQ